MVIDPVLVWIGFYYGIVVGFYLCALIALVLVAGAFEDDEVDKITKALHKLFVFFIGIGMIAAIIDIIRTIRKGNKKHDRIR